MMSENVSKNKGKVCVVLFGRCYSAIPELAEELEESERFGKCNIVRAYSVVSYENLKREYKGMAFIPILCEYYDDYHLLNRAFNLPHNNGNRYYKDVATVYLNDCHSFSSLKSILTEEGDELLEYYLDDEDHEKSFDALLNMINDQMAKLTDVQEGNSDGREGR